MQTESAQDACDQFPSAVKKKKKKKKWAAFTVGVLDIDPPSVGGF